MSRPPIRRSDNQNDNQEDKYMERFAAIEFRALRGYLIHYKESGNFDWWSGVMVGMSNLLFVMAICGSVFSLIHSNLETAVSILGSFLSGSGIIRWLAIGQNDFLPSYDARAQKHVNAAAEMSRVHRLAELYRSQLTAAADFDDDACEQKYKELLSAYKEASSCSVVREKAYKKYSNLANVFEEYDRRNNRVHHYLQHLEQQ